MLGFGSPDVALAARPAAMASVSPEIWARLAEARQGGGNDPAFEAAFANGAAFLAARDGLRNRQPVLVEWKGGHRGVGDEAAPIDLRVDHVFLVSCKYQSQILHNSSPRLLFDHLLSPGATGRGGDWFAEMAPEPYQALYGALRDLGLEGTSSPWASELDPASRRILAAGLRAWPPGVAPLVEALVQAVAEASAARWRSALASRRDQEVMLWRLLRIGAAPYFMLGSSDQGLLRLRVATPFDWRAAFRLRSFGVRAQSGGQARVSWEAVVTEHARGTERRVEGHVEVRWSHGRFAQPPEAKVYLDTSHPDVPGYYHLV
jgi:hypothetical protein